MIHYIELKPDTEKDLIKAKAICSGISGCKSVEQIDKPGDGADKYIYLKTGEKVAERLLQLVKIVW